MVRLQPRSGARDREERHGPAESLEHPLARRLAEHLPGDDEGSERRRVRARGL